MNFKLKKTFLCLVVCVMVTVGMIIGWGNISPELQVDYDSSKIMVVDTRSLSFVTETDTEPQEDNTLAGVEETLNEQHLSPAATLTDNFNGTNVDLPQESYNDVISGTDIINKTSLGDANVTSTSLPIDRDNDVIHTDRTMADMFDDVNETSSSTHYRDNVTQGGNLLTGDPAADFNVTSISSFVGDHHDAISPESSTRQESFEVNTKAPVAEELNENINIPENISDIFHGNDGVNITNKIEIQSNLLPETNISKSTTNISEIIDSNPDVLNSTDRPLSSLKIVTDTVGNASVMNVVSPVDVNVSLSESTASRKVILLWTAFRLEIQWWGLKKFGGWPFRRRGCDYSACDLTTDRSRVQEADMVLFDSHGVPDWPEYRHPHQLYVNFLSEPPSHRFSKLLPHFNGHINMTATYRRDSEVFRPYDRVVTLETPTPGPYVPRVPFERKTRTVAWMVSKCGSPSRRDEYARELARYVDVDVYGACGNFSCARSDMQQCHQHLENNYKFYLSFENNVCQDYVSEKFFRILDHEIVPVVLGMTDYIRDAPPHSFIDVRDFRSPRDLASFLLRMTEVEYVSYFQWKQTHGFWKLQYGHMGHICRLCELAHTHSSTAPAIQDYWQWWSGVCDNDMVLRMRRDGGW